VPLRNYSLSLFLCSYVPFTDMIGCNNMLMLKVCKLLEYLFYFTCASGISCTDCLSCWYIKCIHLQSIVQLRMLEYPSIANTFLASDINHEYQLYASKPNRKIMKTNLPCHA